MKQTPQPTAASDAGEIANSAIQTLQRGANEIGQQARRASSQILEQHVFHFIDDIEQAVRAAARELDGKHHPQLARVVDRAAGEVASVSDRFRTTELSELVSSVEHLARTRPAVAISFALAAGFAFVRFLKSTNTQITANRASEEDGEVVRNPSAQARSSGGGTHSRKSRGDLKAPGRNTPEPASVHR